MAQHAGHEGLNQAAKVEGRVDGRPIQKDQLQIRGRAADIEDTRRIVGIRTGGCLNDLHKPQLRHPRRGLEDP